MKDLSARELLGLSDAMLEGIYSQGLRLYNAGKYKEASQVFRLLLVINPNIMKCVMGFGACFHVQKDYKMALNLYSVATRLDQNNPLPLFHSSDCLIQMGDYASALNVLGIMIEKVGENPRFRRLKERAILMTNGLHELLNSEKKEAVQAEMK